jgi:hypothetical protein
MFSTRYPLNFLNCGLKKNDPYGWLGAADLELFRH